MGTLEKEVNLTFGERHEDSAIDAYAAQLGHKVYGQQRRVSIAMPPGGPSEALAITLPQLRTDPLPPPVDEQVGEDISAKPANTTRELEGDTEKTFFRLTGFVDGLVDLPRWG